MDPNPDVQEPTTTPAPETNQPVVGTPVETTTVIETQTIAMTEPAPVMAPSPVFSEPVAPVQPPVQSVAQSPVFGSTPQPTMVANSAPMSASKISKKMIIIIAAAVAGLIAIGITVWLLFFNGIPLTKYTNTDGGYSIMVPTSYTKEENGSEATFTKPGTTDENKSLVQVNSTSIPSGYRDEYIKMIDTQFTESSFKSGGSFIGSEETSNIKIEKSTKNGADIRIASGNLLDDKKSIKGTFRIGLIIDKEKAFTVIIGAQSTEKDLTTSSARIIDSLTVLK